MKKTSLQINIPFNISLTNEDILEALEKALDIKDYKIMNNILHCYERTSYSDYDYVPVSATGSHIDSIIKKVIDFNCIKEHLE